jgi:DNA replication protein DnaC
MAPSRGGAGRGAGGPVSAGSCPLGLCDGSGFMLDVASNTARDCPCRAARIARARAARLEGRIPRRYRGVSFDRAPVTDLPEPVVAEVRRYVRSISAHLEQGRGLWMVGDVGTGKTTLAMIASKAAIDAGHSVAIYSLPRLLNLIREEVGREGRVIGLLDSLASVDLLHIDDLGAQRSTLWAIEQFYSLVDARYQAARAIVATTNLWPDELARQLSGLDPAPSRPAFRDAAFPGDPLLGPEPLAGHDHLLAEDPSARGVPPGSGHSLTSGDPFAPASGHGAALDQGGVEPPSDAERASGHVGARIVSRLIEICGDPLPLFGGDLRRALPPPAGFEAAGL